MHSLSLDLTNSHSKDNYSTLCTISVDLSKMGKALGPFKGSDGRLYYKANFDIILLFGLTELKAQVCWKEKVSFPRGSHELSASLIPGM